MNLKRTASFVAVAFVVFAALAGSSQAAMLDPGFGDGGVSIVGEGLPKQGPRGLTIDRQGRLLVAGRGGPSGNLFYVARVLGDGSPDATFGTDGYALSGSVGGSSITHGVTGLAPLTQRTGKIVVAGADRIGNASYSVRGLLAGFDANGDVNVDWPGQGML